MGLKNLSFWWTLIINIFVVTSLAGMTATLFIISYVVFFYENPPIEIFNVPYELPKKEYRSGEVFEFNAKLCRYTAAPVTYFTYWDGISKAERHRMIRTSPPVEIAGAHKGECLEDNLFSTVVPELRAGMYQVKFKAVYKVLPFLDRIVESETQPFEVVE